MPGTVRSIIIGAGISAGTPATLGTFPIFSGAIPPDELVDGNLRQDASAPPKVFIGDALLTPGATVIGGATATVATGQSVVIGNGASSLNTAGAVTNVIIGKNAVNGLGNGNVVIGEAATSAGAGASAVDNVVIGRGANITNPAGGASNVIIGALAAQTLGSQNVVIGSSASAAVNNANVVIGFTTVLSGGAGVGSCILIGANTSTNRARTILIGSSLVNTAGGSDSLVMGVSWGASASFPANTVAFFNSAGYTTLIVGKAEVHGAPQGLTFRLTDGLGANIGAGSLTIRPGNATGAGAQGSVIFQTQSAAGGASVLGTMTTQVSIIPCTGAAGQANLRIDNVANGAGVGAGTLANAPAAGNPTFWLPVNIAGTVRYIPCW